ncbi:MAG: beta-lactamase family protein, partial [Clostridia bacterium]|nr:beta-lactamase family protein [Clostridia bacterium]
APVDAVLSSTAKMPHKEAVEAITGNPLSFDPRTSQAYSATDAFDVAAGIVEMISDMPFDEYLKKNIFDPLEMKDTTFAPSSEQWSRMVPMHNRTKDGENQEVPMPEGCVFADFIPERMMAGGGLAVTAQDYIRFADMLCFEGVGKNGKRVLSSKAVRNMATPHVPDEIYMGHERWGLGMRVIISPDYAQGLHVGCFGWSGAYGTHFWVDPENKVCAVMMKNSLFDGGAGNSSACSLERDVSASMDGGRRD